MRDKQAIWGFFAHASIIIGMMFVVFFVIDRFNPAMEFLTSSLSKWLILLFALFSIGNGAFSAVLLFQRQRKREERRFASHSHTMPTEREYAAPMQRNVAAYQPQRELPQPTRFHDDYEQNYAAYHNRREPVEFPQYQRREAGERR